MAWSSGNISGGHDGWAVISDAGRFGDEIVAGRLNEANAHLIAAAPELLAAAILAVETLAPNKDDDFVWAAMSQLIAAIGKARWPIMINHDDNGASEWLHPDEPERERFIRKGCMVAGSIVIAGVIVAVGSFLEWF